MSDRGRAQVPPAPAATRSAWVASVAALVGLVWLVFLRHVQPLDFDVFARAGRAVRAGNSPYPRLGTPAVWSGHAFVYPWATAWLFAPLAATGSGALLMTAASGAAIAGAIWAVRGRDLAAFAAVLLASPTLDGLQMGTVNAFLLCGLCLAWRWRSRPVAAGFVLGLVITVKLFCWPVLGWLLLTRRLRAASVAMCTAVLLLAAGWWAGPIGPLRYAQMLAELSAHEAAHSSGLQGVLIRAGTSTSVAQLFGIGCGVAVLLAARRADATTFAASVLAALFASPIVWHHYYLLAAAPLLLTRRGPWWYLVLGWASGAVHAGALSWFWLSVVAEIALLTLAARAVCARPQPARAVLHRVVRNRLAVAAAAAAICAVGGSERVRHALGPSWFSVGACVGVYAAAVLPASGRRLEKRAEGNVSLAA